MNLEDGARSVLAIIKEGGFTVGDVAHADDIVRPWIKRGGGSPELHEALRHCVAQGWLVEDTRGHKLTEAGAAQ
jgi:hypothetical protein